MRRTPSRKGERLIDLLECRAVIFFVSISFVEVGFELRWSPAVLALFSALSETH
jgi:hypothetical protein